MSTHNKITRRTIVFKQEYIKGALQTQGLTVNQANIQKLIDHLMSIACDATWKGLFDFNRYGYPPEKEQEERNPFADMSYLEPTLHASTCTCGCQEMQ